MRSVVISTGVLSVLIPDEITSMYDEELFIQINDLNSSISDGTLYHIKINGVSFYVVIWSHVGRFYFDEIIFSDFSVATVGYEFTIPAIVGFSQSFLVRPAKERLPGLYKFLPFWDLKNTFSIPTATKIYFNQLAGAGSETFTNTGKNELNAITGYYIGDTLAAYDAPRETCSDSVYFEWIDNNGFWRSWFFLLKENRRTPRIESSIKVKNIDSSLNERLQNVDLKSDSVQMIFSSGWEPKDVFDILATIKSSSYVFMGTGKERVNVRSEETTDRRNISEFIFTVTKQTKVAR